MTKKIEKKATRTQSGQNLSALWLCFMMFVVGYLAASWFDVNQFVTWVGAHLKGHPPVEKSVAKKAEEVTPAIEQHPKLEFYTLLTSDSGLHGTPSAKINAQETTTVDMQYKNVPEKPGIASPGPMPMELAVSAPTAPPQPVKHAEPPQLAPKPVYTPPPKPMPIPTADRRGQYVLQVGSFHSLTEAKRMRDKLGQKGYPTNIVTVMQQSSYLYRVMLGPFSSLSQVQQMQITVSRREHIIGMIRKLDGRP
jgi:cell division protein FtsN